MALVSSRRMALQLTALSLNESAKERKRDRQVKSILLELKARKQTWPSKPFLQIEEESKSWAKVIYSLRMLRRFRSITQTRELMRRKWSCCQLFFGYQSYSKQSWPLISHFFPLISSKPTTFISSMFTQNFCGTFTSTSTLTLIFASALLYLATLSSSSQCLSAKTGEIELERSLTSFLQRQDNNNHK